VRFIDTNVLLYTISRDPAEQAKAKRANDILTDRDLALSVQVLQEFYLQATRASRPDAIAHQQAVRLIESFRRFDGSGDQPGQPGREDGTARGRGPCYPDDQAGHGDDPVVGPQHSGPEPIQPPGGAASVRLPGVGCPPLRGRLDLSIRGRAVISTHVFH
jgi:PIN domain